MNEAHYIISDAAKLLHTEPHVLRYWEEELNLKIPRNKMGHRIYGKNEIDLFGHIIRWKDQGLSLKEIEAKCILAGFASGPNPSGQVIPYPTEHTVSIASAPDIPAFSADEKMKQFRKILGRIVHEAIRENNTSLSSEIASRVSDGVNKELDFLFREKEDADEKRFRDLDETIRNIQAARQEAAAAQTALSEKKKHRSFRKKKNS